jgi:hypothetical protein
MTTTALPRFLTSLPKLTNVNTFEHPVDPFVKFVASGRYSHFTYKGRTITGVHELLGSVIWPNYSYEEAKYNETGKQATALAATQWKPRHSTADPSTIGRKKGVKADNVLIDSLKLKRKYHLDEELFAEDRHRKRVKLDHCRLVLEKKLQAPSLIGEQRLLMKLLNAFCPDLRLIWYTLNKYKLRPVACQVVCGIEGLFATAIDCVALDQEGAVIPIEQLKGGQNYLYKHTKTRLSYPFTDKNDCLLHRKLIQMGAGLLAYRQSYSQLIPRIGIPKVLRINENPEASELFDLPDWILGRGDQLLAALRAKPKKCPPPKTVSGETKKEATKKKKTSSR